MSKPSKPPSRQPRSSAASSAPSSPRASGATGVIAPKHPSLPGASHTPSQTGPDTQPDTQPGTAKAALQQISHELRTPIGTIMALSDMICTEQFGPLGNEKYREYVEDIHASAHHALKVLTTSLDTALTASLEPASSDAATEVDINAILKACLKLTEPNFSASGIILRREIAPELHHVATRATLLHQIILNLLGNALKYTPEDGTITARSELCQDGSIRLSIIDTGLGIAATELATLRSGNLPPRVNDPSTQASDKISNKSGIASSHGLGLNLIRAQAKACGAEFTIESQRGRGTTTCLIFSGE